MTQEHPITPPPELVKQWESTAYGAAPIPYTHHIARCAARWGADQELEWCVSYVDNNFSGNAARALRALRRPKQPSLKEQALSALYAIATGADDTREFHQDLETIKQALESLPS